jgi:hypothetical protein
MEIIHQQSIDLERVADLCEIGIKRDPPQPRSGALWHVSSLLKAGKSIIKGKVAYLDGGPASMPSIAALGRIWETAMDSYMADYAVRELGGYFQPDVILDEDGICGSLDGMLFGAEAGMVYECKLRFTLNQEIPLGHLRQIRAYCHLAGVDTVCYVSGHISTTPPMIQATMRWLRLTMASIEENWQGLLNTKRYLESQGISPEREEQYAKSQ